MAILCGFCLAWRSDDGFLVLCGFLGFAGEFAGAEAGNIAEDQLDERRAPPGGPQ